MDLIRVIKESFDYAKKVYDSIISDEKMFNIVSKGNKPNDFLSEIDRLISNATKEYLVKAKFPARYGSEESNLVDLVENPEYFVYLDPIDGTGNSVQGIKDLPHCFTISIANKVENFTFNDVVAAGVFNFQSGTYWIAEKNKGLETNAVGKDAKRTLILDNYQQTYNTKRSLSSNFYEQIKKHEFWIKDFGSSAFHLAMVSSGNFSAYYSPAQKSDELLAGYLLIKEGKGIVVDLEGKDIGEKIVEFKQNPVIAATDLETAERLRNIIIR